MARKKRSDNEVLDQEERVASESDETNAGNGDATESTALEESQVVDLITGDKVKLDEMELIRQEEQRKLLEEFGYPEKQKADLIRRNYRVKPKQLKARKLSLVVFSPIVTGKTATDEERVYILID